MNLEQAIANRLHYYKHQRNIIKAHETKNRIKSFKKGMVRKIKKTKLSE